MVEKGKVLKIGKFGDPIVLGPDGQTYCIRGVSFCLHPGDTVFFEYTHTTSGGFLMGKRVNPPKQEAEKPALPQSNLRDTRGYYKVTGYMKCTPFGKGLEASITDLGKNDAPSIGEIVFLERLGEPEGGVYNARLVQNFGGDTAKYRQLADKFGEPASSQQKDREISVRIGSGRDLSLEKQEIETTLSSHKRIITIGEASNRYAELADSIQKGISLNAKMRPSDEMSDVLGEFLTFWNCHAQNVAGKTAYDIKAVLFSVWGLLYTAAEKIELPRQRLEPLEQKFLDLEACMRQM